MSLRHAIRSRFRGDKDKENNSKETPDSRDTSPWRGGDGEEEAASTGGTPPPPSATSSANSSQALQSASSKNASTSPEEETSTSLGGPAEGRRTLFSGTPQGSVETRSLREQDEKSVYEAQLNQLQEQLVAAMIENQTLGGELQNFKEKNQVEKILKDLEYERLRNHQLSQQLDEAKHHRSWSLRKRKLQRTQTEPVEGESRGTSMEPADLSDWVDVAQEATEHISPDTTVHEGEGGPTTSSPCPRALRDRLHEWLIHTFYELMADFTEEPEVETQDDGEGDPLTVKKLKDNIKRFRNDAKPIVSTVKGVQRLLMWRTPSVTLIVFIVYMYSVWVGWLVPVMLSLAIFKLSLNYLMYKGWNINITLLAELEEEDKNKEADGFKDLGMSDKFNLVVQVARQVQNLLGKLADNLEKMKNLFLWRQPESTMQLYLFLWVSFILSCVFPGKTLFTIIALYTGIKMFIIEYIFTRFPRIKRRHDSTYRIWKGLPTDSLLEKQYQKAAIDRSAVPSRSVGSVSTSDGDRVHDDDRGFCELFALPIAETPLPGWRGGRRCTLINRDKSLTAAFKHGKLYLTRSFLCFERSKTTAMKNIVIPQTEITRIEKAKPYSWMPGGGMSIEVTVKDQDKPYMFGAILNRDECFDSIIANGLKLNHAWSFEATNGGSTSPTSSPTSPPQVANGSDAAPTSTADSATTSTTSAPSTTTTMTTTTASSSSTTTLNKDNSHTSTAVENASDNATSQS